MNIKDLISNTSKLQYKELCSALIGRFGVKQAVKWDSVLPHEQQQTLFGGEILRLISDHLTLANQKEIRPVCLMKGELSQLLFFYMQLKDEKLPKAVIERIARKFIGGAAADRYIIWFFGNKTADVLKIVISGKEGKKIRLKTLTLEAGQWFKTYEYILSEVERKFNTDGLFQEHKEPSGLWRAIWDAFDISIVNKKFYAEIKAIFDTLTKEELPKCKGILTNEQERVQFAIRLIGRIIFCWFLKRKGIITNDVLSSRAVESQQNYYRDLLEPLFFYVFNTPLNERRKDLPDSIKNYPFLNGGLFEPQHHDHKGNWALNISNNWFINFFNNTLERYNFTVDENSAASSEIAIDPEMLGRIFENLLAEQNPETGESARKATGSYYTPREIVDFMVEESLIAYLKTQQSSRDDAILYPLSKGAQPISDEAIEDFVHTEVLPDALKPNSKELLDRLNAIRVLDPACGSGAFPISMLQKLVALKHQLAAQDSPYNLKLKSIENSIYGVDIQPMATELSRLRCWLSLIVDEDPKDIKPLPNLDFKFVTANSLMDLGYEEFIRTMQTKKSGGLLLIANFLKNLDALKAIRQKYFEPTLNQNRKDELKNEFNTIKDNLFNMSLELIKQKLLEAEFANKVTGWDPFDDSKPAPFFNKSWMFGVENGFDVVIGNPPYLGFQGIDKSFKKVLRKQFVTTEGKFDLYIPFIEKGYDLLKDRGFFVFICPTGFTKRNHGGAIRKFLIEHTKLQELVDFEHAQIFDQATNYTGVFSFVKASNRLNKLRYRNGFNENPIFINQEELSDKPWIFSRSLDASIIAKMQHFFKLGDISKISEGVVTGLNTLYLLKEDVIKQNKFELTCFVPCYRGKDIDKYYLKNFSEFLFYPYKLVGEKTLPVDESELQQNCPRFMKHLKENIALINKRKYFMESSKRWYELWNQRDFANFNLPKIVTPELSDRNRFSLVPSKYFYGDTICGIVLKNEIYDKLDLKFLLAVLNSKLIEWFYKKTTVPKAGGFYIFKVMFLRNIPIKIPQLTDQMPIVSLVDQILSLKEKNSATDISLIEREIDRLVYMAYELTPEEIEIVRGHNV